MFLSEYSNVLQTLLVSIY